MNCEDFELQAQDCLDRHEQQLPVVLQSHVDECVNCRASWKNLRQVVDLTADWSRVEFPSNLIDEVLAQWQSGSFPTPVETMPAAVTHSIRSGASRWAAICAPAALILAVAVMLQIRPTHSSPDQVAQQTGSDVPVKDLADVPTRDDSSLEPPSVADLLGGMHSGYSLLAHRTAETLDGWHRLPTTVELIPTLSVPAATSTAPADALWPRLDRPVSKRVSQALDFLWDTLPQDSSQAS